MRGADNKCCSIVRCSLWNVPTEIPSTRDREPQCRFYPHPFSRRRVAERQTARKRGGAPGLSAGNALSVSAGMKPDSTMPLLPMPLRAATVCAAPIALLLSFLFLWLPMRGARQPASPLAARHRSGCYGICRMPKPGETLRAAMMVQAAFGGPGGRFETPVARRRPTSR